MICFFGKLYSYGISLSSLNGTWGQSNSFCLTSSKPCNMYEQMHVSNPARKCEKFIDPISLKINKNSILHSDILLWPTISEHDAPYISISFLTNKVEIRFKFIRNLKHFDLDFKILSKILRHCYSQLWN